ncbi:MAG: hypothetical protein ACREBB_04865 [Nitrosotalea sp.]
MVKVSIMLQVNASFEKIWDMISNVDDDSNYWTETVRIKNLSKNRNGVTREVRLSDGRKCQQKVTLFPKERIHIRYTKGPMIGIKDLMLIDKGRMSIIRVQINYKLEAGQDKSASVLKELQSEAEHALHLIKKHAERKP